MHMNHVIHNFLRNKFCIDTLSTGVVKLATTSNALRQGEAGGPASGFTCHSLPRWRKPTGRGMSFHDLSSMITEIRSTIPRVQLIQSTSYKTDLSHRSTTKTAYRYHLQPTAYHICKISILKPEAIAVIPLLGHAEIKQNFFL